VSVLPPCSTNRPPEKRSTNSAEKDAPSGRRTEEHPAPVGAREREARPHQVMIRFLPFDRDHQVGKALS
jgi:hypothetical protein